MRAVALALPAASISGCTQVATVSTQASSPVAARPATVRVVAAGDIATCDGAHDTAAGKLVRALAPRAVLTLGDHAYDDGGRTAFRRRSARAEVLEVPGRAARRVVVVSRRREGAAAEAAQAASDARGVRQIVVGTGGASLYPAGWIRNRRAATSSDYGVLELVLRPRGYDTRFVPVAGLELHGQGQERRLPVGVEPREAKKPLAILATPPT